MTHLSLFSGIGGLDLAAEWAGFQTVGQCEFADYPTKVLEKYWPDVPRWRDIRTLTGESFRERTGCDTVDLVSGGFPCQPFSVAGKRKGQEDNRFLWPEMLRVIRELKPRWVVGENVPGIINIAADEVCADLERAGYEVWIFEFEAAAVGAPHRRNRVAFVAHSTELQCNTGTEKQSVLREVQDHKREHDYIDRPSQTRNTTVADTKSEQQHREVCSRRWRAGLADSGASSSDTEVKGLEGPDPTGRTPAGRRDLQHLGLYWWATEPNMGGMVDGLSQWLDEPDIPRVATGVKNRVDRLKCLGNAVVPQQFYPIFKAIADCM